MMGINTSDNDKLSVSSIIFGLVFIVGIMCIPFGCQQTNDNVIKIIKENK